MKKWFPMILSIALVSAIVPLAAVQAEKPAKESGKGDKDTGKPEKDTGKPDKPEKDKPEKDKPEKEDNVKEDGKQTTGDDGAVEDGQSSEETEAADGTEAAETTTEEGTVEEGAAEGQPADAVPTKKEAVKQAVKLKKEIITLRQELKKAKEITPEIQAKYEALTKELETVSALGEALAVQKELLEKVYKPGDLKQYEKLGELFEQTGDESLKTFVNGEEVEADQQPFISRGRAMVPVRAISKALKAEVNYNAETKTIEITRGESTITLYLDKKEAVVNGETVTLESAPVIKNGRVFLPLRFIGESLDATVGYQEEGKIVIIEDPEATGEETAAPTESADTPATEEQTTEDTSDTTTTPETTPETTPTTPDPETTAETTTTTQP